MNKLDFSAQIQANALLPIPKSTRVISSSDGSLPLGEKPGDTKILAGMYYKEEGARKG
jgi:hypothetical protein